MAEPTTSAIVAAGACPPWPPPRIVEGTNAAAAARACPAAHEDKTMADTEGQLLTAGKIAKELGVSDGKVKKAIQALGLEPDAKKGACAYYGPAALAALRDELSPKAAE